MFKCKECGSEYEIKPDYCDCGNNTFDEIVIQQPPKQEPKQDIKQIKEDRPVVYPKKTEVPHKTSNKTFSEQYPEFDRIKKNFDPISTVVFVLCLITSLIVLFFVGNPEPKVAENTQQEEEKPQIAIPSIDTFWNNSTAGIINYEKTKAQKAAQVQTTPQQQTQQQTNPLIGLMQPNRQEQQPIQTQVSQQQIPQPVKVQAPKQTQTQQPTKPQQTQQKAQPTPQNNTIVGKIFGNNSNNKQTTNSNTQKQNTQPQQKAQSKQTNVSPKIPTTTQNIATQPKNTKTTISTQTTVVPQPQKVNKQTTSNNNTAAKPTASKTGTTINIPSNNTLRPQATIDTQALKRELDSYKIGLRNTLGRKVDFTKVIGDGECVVAFKIASNGKLTNRSFAKQSSNITLNDAVYSAIMSTPSYNPPPSGYKNETLNLKIRFYGGNYDVSLY